ncbi:MAG: PIN domain-containing protein [Patescibacteria group bacterium]
MGIISLDTNIFISAFDPANPLHTKCHLLLEKISQNNTQVTISVLVFQEFLVKIYSSQLENELAKYEEYLTSNGTFTVVNIDRAVARAAAKIRSDYPTVKGHDAIHLASAIESKSREFYTTEKHLPKKIGPLQIKTI